MPIARIDVGRISCAEDRLIDQPIIAPYLDLKTTGDDEEEIDLPLMTMLGAIAALLNSKQMRRERVLREEPERLAPYLPLFHASPRRSLRIDNSSILNSD